MGAAHSSGRSFDEKRFDDGYELTERKLARFDPLRATLYQFCLEAREQQDTYRNMHPRSKVRSRASADARSVRNLVQPYYYGLVEEWHDHNV